MSLKAKIEAVIYAAEEPVTLAQLAAIFAAEVPVAAGVEEPNDTPRQLDAFFEQSAASQADEHELTMIDDAGTMADMPHGSAEAGAPRLDPEGQDVVRVNTETITPDPDALSDLTAKAAVNTRQREREVRECIRKLVAELMSDFQVQERGMEIREIAGGYRMATKPEYHDAVRAFVKSLKPVMKLSLQALETLAVIAYKQPVTSPEVAEIRGVDSGGVLAGLISRKLVTTAGRKQVIGRPILYKTTKEFLLRFGLKDIGELPSMEEFEKIAGELAESDAIEADAMHERAGIEASAENENANQLPFEQDALEGQVKEENISAVTDQNGQPGSQQNDSQSHGSQSQES